MADAGVDDDLVLLEAHARTSPVAEAATGKFCSNDFFCDRESRGKAFDDDDERWAVGLPGREEPEHTGNLLPQGLGAECVSSERFGPCCFEPVDPPG